MTNPRQLRGTPTCSGGGSKPDRHGIMNIDAYIVTQKKLLTNLKRSRDAALVAAEKAEARYNATNDRLADAYDAVVEKVGLARDVDFREAEKIVGFSL